MLPAVRLVVPFCVFSKLLQASPTGRWSMVDPTVTGHGLPPLALTNGFQSSTNPVRNLLLGLAEPEGFPSPSKRVVCRACGGEITVDPTRSRGPAGPFLLAAWSYRAEIFSLTAVSGLNREDLGDTMTGIFQDRTWESGCSTRKWSCLCFQKYFSYIISQLCSGNCS